MLPLRYLSSNSSGGGTIFGYGGIGVVIHKDTWIGDNVTIAQNVTIASKDGGAPRIGDNTYIGANSVIIGNISIGKNVFIGALSLVNKDVPDNAICYGIPSKVIRFRSEEELAVFKEWSERQRK